MTEKEIQQAVAAGVEQGIQQYFEGNHPCRIPISDDAAKKIPHFLGMVSDLDEESNFDQGVEIMRKNHEWIKKRREEKDDEYAANHRWVSAWRCRTTSLWTKIFEWVVLGIFAYLALLAGAGFWGQIKEKLPK